MSKENAVIETLKTADAGDGNIVRMFECEGRDTEFKLSLPYNQSSVFYSDLSETGLSEIEVQGSTASLKIGVH